MTIDDEDNGAGVGAQLRRAVGEEPPMMLNAGAIARQGASRLRRRRATAVGGSILAVAALTAGVALGVPRLANTVVGAAASTSVPGCATVLHTDAPAVIAWRDRFVASSTGPSSPGSGAVSSSSVAETSSTTSAAAPTNVYGLPAPAWLTAEKAASMAAAFSAAIPAGVHLSAPDNSAQVGPLPFAAGSGVAGGGVVLTAGSARAFLNIEVQQRDKGAPPCTANLAHRYTSPDGAITDVIDEPGTSETGHYLIASSYRPDGTFVYIGLNNSDVIPPTATLPLTVQQLAAIAATPALAITTP